MTSGLESGAASSATSRCMSGGGEGGGVVGGGGDGGGGVGGGGVGGGGVGGGGDGGGGDGGGDSGGGDRGGGGAFGGVMHDVVKRSESVVDECGVASTTVSPTSQPLKTSETRPA